MDSTQKRSGETIVVRHIPLVHCQIPGKQCCNPVLQTNPFCPPDNLGMTRTTSLPERDVLGREGLVYSSLIQTSSSSESSGGLGGGTVGRGSLSDSSSFASNNSEEPSLPPASLRPRSRNGSNPLRRNPFLFHADEDEDEDEDEEDGDNLNKYLEDFSFHLHGLSNANISKVAGVSSFHLHDLGLTPEPFLLQGTTGTAWCTDGGKLRAPDAAGQQEGLELLTSEGQRQRGSSCSTLSMDCGDEEDEEENGVRNGQGGRACSCCSSLSGATRPQSRRCCCSCEFSEPFSDSQQGYGSDSSCNSSDGVLVNFSAIYNGVNNAVPAKPLSLTSCTASSEQRGAFYLDLHTSPVEPQRVRNGPSQDLDNLAGYCCTSPRALDANRNSCRFHCDGLSSPEAVGLTCAQSHTQNYYKLVTCDLSSQSSPSPAGSTATSCSSEHAKGSPLQPQRYFLFGRPEEYVEAMEEEENVEPKEPPQSEQEEGAVKMVEGQVYVNASHPVGRRGERGTAEAAARPRSRSYDRTLDKSPLSRLCSMERMLSCPVRLSEGSAPCLPPPPPRVTSFAEIARSKRRAPGKTGDEASCNRSPPSLDPSHSLDKLHLGQNRSFAPQLSEPTGQSHHETRTKAEGGSSSPSEAGSAVVRYNKDQRPTSLPIQAFTFQHQVTRPQGKPLRPLLNEYLSQMQSRAGGPPVSADERQHSQAAPEAVRPSPLGSYSPVRQQGAPTSGTCSTCTPSPDGGYAGQRPPGTLFCPMVANSLSPHNSPGASVQPPPAPPLLHLKKEPALTDLPTTSARCVHHNPVPPTGFSPQSHPTPCCHSSNDNIKAPVSQFIGPQRPAGPFTKHLQLCQSEFLPDYFALAERPPEEFCLSPDATPKTISIDLLQKKDLVKAVNVAVDLIVAHFGSTRDPGVKAKLGNSSVSPNVGHLILKYLCPAIRDVLQDGLKGYVLDFIVGQRRNLPWSVVEASTQPGPSTRVLNCLFSKVSQYCELNSHSMRLNAFIFGLLNLRSLEFWFNHLYTHEDVVMAHYQPWGFLFLSQAACQPQFQELLLLLQPLSLLPFDLDLLFEPHQLRKGQEHIRHKEQLCSTGQGLEQSARSTFQLMRGWSKVRGEAQTEGVGAKGAGLKKEPSEGWKWPWRERMEPMRDGMETGGCPELQRGTKGEGPALTEALRGGEWRLSQTGTGLLRECNKDEGGGDLEGGRRAHGVVGSETQTERAGKVERESLAAAEGARQRAKQAGWWDQLRQSSQVYIDNSAEGSKFVKWEKRKRPTGKAERSRVEDRGSQPPPRVGVVEGAEADLKQEGSGGSVDEGKGMGSPPESMVKGSTVAEPETQGGTAGVHQERPSAAMRWGRLFGAGTSNPTRTEGAEQSLSRSQKSRLPSGWLTLDRSMLDLMAQTVVVGKRSAPPSSSQKDVRPPDLRLETQAIKPQTLWEVRALCHHIATDPGQLSFNKGDRLRVLSQAEPDWLHCALGDSTGLVPIVYVTLTEESH